MADARKGQVWIDNRGPVTVEAVTPTWAINAILYTRRAGELAYRLGLRRWYRDFRGPRIYPLAAIEADRREQIIQQRLPSEDSR